MDREVFAMLEPPVRSPRATALTILLAIAACQGDPIANQAEADIRSRCALAGNGEERRNGVYSVILEPNT